MQHLRLKELESAIRGINLHLVKVQFLCHPIAESFVCISQCLNHEKLANTDMERLLLVMQNAIEKPLRKLEADSMRHDR